MKMLKRIILFLILFASVIAIEVVYADMSAPELRPYEVVVTDTNGLDYYNYKGEVAGHLNKGDTVLVIYEYDGKYTLGKKVTKYGFETNESIGSVNTLDGFSLVENEVDPTKYLEDSSITKLEEPKKALVYSSEGIDVYKGPSETYEKVGHINKDTVLTYKYLTDSYIYVINGDVKGWIKVLKGKVLLENNTQYIFRTDVDTKCGIIPKNSITTPTFKTDMWEHKTLFEYNNCTVLLNSFRDKDVLDIYPIQNTVTKEITLYKYADSTTDIVGTVPADTEVTVLAGGDFMSGTEGVRYIKYNDLVGWSLDDDSVFEWKNTNEEKEPETVEDTIKIEDIELPGVNNNGGSVVMPRSNMGLIIFILLCVLGTTILVATAIVIIVLVNRTKKKEVTKEQK